MSLFDFLKYYNKFKDKIFNYFFYRTGFNRELSEDFVSDIFEKAINSIDSFDDTKEFGPWIYRIAHNYLVDFYKKDKKDLSIDALFEANENIEEDLNLKYEENFEYNIDNEILRKDLLKYINKLSQSEKEIITLKFIDDMDYEEMAHLLNKKEGAIRVAIHRVLIKLKKIIEEDNEK